jgi:hypothetical protein
MTHHRIVGISLVILLLGFVHSAKADGLQIVCTGSTTCLAGGVETTTSTSPTFDVQLVGNNAGGELWIAVLVPTSSNPNFTAPNNTTLWTALSEGSGGSDHNFGSTVGNNPLFGSNTGFNVSDFDTLHTISGGGSVSVSLPQGSYAAGTMFVAFTEDNSDNITADSPWSESLLIESTGTTTTGTTGTTTGTTGGTTGSPVPEPGTFMLLGSGLTTLGLLKRRIWWPGFGK